MRGISCTFFPGLTELPVSIHTPCAKLAGRGSKCLKEYPGKIAEVVESAGQGDFGNAFFGFQQKIPAALEPVSVHVLDGRLPHKPAEDLTALAAADVPGGRDVLQRELLSVMQTDIRRHLLLRLHVRVPAGLT